jgi:hypothetical protein
MTMNDNALFDYIINEWRRIANDPTPKVDWIYETTGRRNRRGEHRQPANQIIIDDSEEGEEDSYE